MKMTKVTSSNIQSVGWFDSSLRVEFVNGSVYRYWNVPEVIYKDILDLQARIVRGEKEVSIGKYFNSTVRNVYKYSRVKEADKVTRK